MSLHRIVETATANMSSAMSSAAAADVVLPSCRQPAMNRVEERGAEEQGAGKHGKQAIHLLFIVNSLTFGGAEKHVVSLLNHLDTTRFRMSLAYLKNDGSLLPQLKQTQLDGRIYCCDVKRKLDFSVAKKLAKIIEDEQIDSVIAINGYALLYAVLACKLSAAAPKLVDLFHSSPFHMRSLKARLQMWCYRPLFARCDMLVYVCENQRRYWRNRSLKARDDAVIYNGIELSRFTDKASDTEKIRLRQSYGWSGDDFVIGVCAVMRPEKAHADLLAALAGLPPSLLHVRCLFIGDGPERQKIEKAIIALGLAHRVGITGYLADVRLAVSACDVMALVSHAETFSLAALEAMALGKPVIMSEVGGASEQIEHGVHGYLVERGNIKQMTRCIADLVRSGMAKQMGLAARRKVSENFSHLQMATAYQSLFSDLNNKVAGKEPD